MLVNKRVLIIGYVWVEPNSSAAGSRMLQLVHFFLKTGYQVTFASPAQKSSNEFSLETLGVDEKLIVLNSSSFDTFIKDLMPDIVLFDRFMMEEQFGWRVAQNYPKAIRILDTEDLHFLRKIREQCVKQSKKVTTEILLNSSLAKREIASILRCDLSLIISTFEMELLRNTFKIERSLLHYLPFMLEKIEDFISNNWCAFEEREHFVFVGNFFHAPNIDAVIQLKKVLWKGIRKELPNAQLHIYGAYVTQQIKEFHKPADGFYVHGFEKDIAAVVERARVVLAPLRFGAGIKGKLTEAMCLGTPSVTTTIGAEGMQNGLPWNGFVVDEWNDFIEKAKVLYSDKEVWTIAQNNGKSMINTIYDREILMQKFTKEIEKIYNDIQKHRIYNFYGSMLQHHSLQATKYMSKWIEEKNK